MNTPNGNTCTLNAAEPIAIVSAACRLPGHVNNPHKLWELLQTGGTAVSNEVPKSRFDSTGHFDGSGRPGTMKALSGMFIEDVDPAIFDARFFNLTRADAIAMDPQQRQLLEVVYECFENGGVPIERVSGEQIGCFVGSYTVDYHDMQNRAPGQRPPGMTVGIGRAILSNRISHFYNLKGPSWTIDTACSGGLVGVDVACQYLRAGKMNGAIVAAANLWMSPEHTQELGTMRAAYSVTGRCHTFDAKADGYCRAEAVNAVYLKRLSDAIADGDPIRAVIRGTANNSDGWTAGINSPSSDAQSAVIRAAYADAGIDSNHFAQTGFLECHGTGTPAGDPLEVKGAASVLAHMRPQSDPLVIGSIKSNIGHSEPGAGISGLIKAIMAVEQGWIPGNPTFINPSPNIDFEGLRIRATRPGIPWPKSSNHYRRASINSFGYGGSNAHVVLDNAEHFIQQSSWPLKTRQPHISSYVKSSDLLSLLVRNGGRQPKVPVQRPQVLVFSANDQDSLKGQIEALYAHLLDPRVRVKLSNLSYTLSNRRSRHFCRAFLLSHPTKAGLASNISLASAQFAKTPHRATKIGFVFTGQGAQWAQMGAELVKTFPRTVKPLLEELDSVLQELPLDVRPEWSLLSELTEPRPSEHLRKPEFSQPLVTALQLAQLNVLESWDVQADVVVGHSSGEIAAACSAGLLTPKQAILVAYFRGLAARDAVSTEPMGMMAVGLGAKDVQRYLNTASSRQDVVIACYNSPASVTLSGTSALLAELLEIIKADGHFARILQVEVAYHSHHLSKAAHLYENLLLNHVKLEGDSGKNNNRFTHMVSSVTEESVNKTEVCNAAYWKQNMVSPVKFEGACKRIFGDANLDPNFFIELGPSNALAGPVAQIAKETGVEKVTYTAASKRGQDSVHALFDVAGQLFLHNAQVSLSKVNIDETSKETVVPATIIDLPNYKWNHSTRYWYESLASKDWRLRTIPEHDLLGSKVLGTLWQNPSWHKTLRLSDVPWMRDHQIGSEILFPAAGYIAMAIEAVRQTVFSTTPDQDMARLNANEYHYCLRDVKFPRGLVLEEDNEVDMMLLLAPTAKLGRGWWEYRIMSLAASELEASSPPSPEAWKENSSGSIRLQMNVGASLPQAPDDAYTLPFKHSTPAKLWYKAMTDVGYSYGPAFQKQLAVECVEGKRSARALISLEPPPSKWEPQSEYPLHPAPLDGCIQSVFTSLHRGNRNSFLKVLLPKHIDELTISGQTWRSNEAVSVTTSRNALSDASVYDPTSGALIMDLKGLSFSAMNVRDSVHLSHTYLNLVWKPDFHHLDSDEKLQQALLSAADDPEIVIHELLDLAAHKAPNLKVLEFNFELDDTGSLWLAAESVPRSVRAALSEFHFASDSASTVLAAEQRYSASLATQPARFSLLDPFSKTFSPLTESSVYDVVVVRWSDLDDTSKLKRLLSNVYRLLAEGGSVILYDPKRPSVSEGEKKADENDVFDTFERAKFQKIRRTVGGSCTIAEVGSEHDIDTDIAHAPSNRNVVLVRFSSSDSPVISEIASQLQTSGWSFTELSIHDQSGHGLAQLPSQSTVLVLDEMDQSILATATEEQWAAIQILMQKECDLLWVTQGSQIEPTAPIKAVCHGLFRTVRAEVPVVRIMTLDVQTSTIEGLPATVPAIDAVLRELKSAKSKASLPVECEFAERQGLLHVSRVRSDDAVNQVKIEDDAGGPSPVERNFHATDSTIRLVTERPGSLEALHFAEVGLGQTLKPDEVEIEISASGCTPKDLDIAMGVGSDDAKELGYEGAGVVIRTGDSVTNRHIGQRVALIGKGCFANRAIVSSKATFPLPSGMTFVEAATLPVAFLTSIYGLRHLAGLQKGQRVLIDSATGGVGIACIQFCQRFDCEIFVTVDSPEQRDFLANDFKLRQDHIFLSYSTDYARRIHEAPESYGMDIIIQEISKESLLQDIWRLLAPGGTLVSIAGRAVEQGSGLFIEQTATNRSFRSLDITILPLETIAEVFSELSHLIDNGHARAPPVYRVLGYDEIAMAFQLLREGTHIGKLVVSNESETDVAVPVRPARLLASSLLNPDHSYLFVGGLKGICGSLAIHLASQGAKHIAIMSRSGYQDDVSQSVADNIRSLGCSLDLLRSDVTSIEDVRDCFRQISVPIGGIVQGAAVFRDRTFESMSHTDYHAALSCKVQGTTNLHSVSLEIQQPIAFFTMLSSISGVVGQKGQANYAGGNAFEDAFAGHRRAIGLPAISINLGPIEDIGVIQGNDALQGRFENGTWFGINESLLRRIFDYSLLQQQPDSHHRLNPASQAQMITGLAFPQSTDSELLRDVRFGGLRAARGGDGQSLGGGGGDGKDAELRALFLLTQSSDSDRAAVLSAAIAVIGTQLTKQLRLTEAIDPARQLLQYGMDSLAAVEFRNWVRTTLKVELTTLDVVNASSLVRLSDKVIGKMGVL